MAQAHLAAPGAATTATTPPARGHVTRTSSRAGSVASLWSSADVPFFLDARKSSEVSRSGSYADGASRAGSFASASSSRWPCDGDFASSSGGGGSGPQSATASTRASSSSSSSSRNGGSQVAAVDNGIGPSFLASLDSLTIDDIDIAPPRNSSGWPRREVPAGPMSPRPSLDSSMFPVPRLSISTRPSADSLGDDVAPFPSQMQQPSPQPQPPQLPHSHSSSSSLSTSSSPLRGFQNRKPVTLQIQPVAYSSPLRPTSASRTPTNDSPGELSTAVPSLGLSPSPAPSRASTDLHTPMTGQSAGGPGGAYSQAVKSATRRSKKAEAKHNALYARAGDFFSADYTMEARTDYDLRSRIETPPHSAVALDFDVPEPGGPGPFIYPDHGDFAHHGDLASFAPDMAGMTPVKDIDPSSCLNEAPYAYSQCSSVGPSSLGSGERSPSSLPTVNETPDSPLKSSWALGGSPLRPLFSGAPPSGSASPTRFAPGPAIVEPLSRSPLSRSRSNRIPFTRGHQHHHNTTPTSSSAAANQLEPAIALGSSSNHGVGSVGGAGSSGHIRSHPSSLSQQPYSPVRIDDSGDILYSPPESPTDGMNRKTSATSAAPAAHKPRLRTLSTPKLHSVWQIQDEARAAAMRKASFCTEAQHHRAAKDLPSPPPSRLQHIRIASAQQLRSPPASSSSSAEGPQSPRGGRLFRPSSRQASGTASANANALSTSTAPTTKAPKSPSQPKSRQAGWSSYLAEGLTLYLDQGGKRECALKMPYLSYDPFGRPESLVRGGDNGELGVGGHTSATLPRKAAKLRPSSSRDALNDEVGILEFGRSSFSEPAPVVSFAINDSDTTILRHLGIGEDTKADLLTRQAALSLEETGVHQVSGFERSGRIAWRFSYEVEHALDAHTGLPSATERLLRPISFACSATLLDPSRARRARIFKMMKKGVASNLASNLVQLSPGRHVGHGKTSSTPHVAVTPPLLTSATQGPQRPPLFRNSHSGSDVSDSRRPSTTTRTSASSVQRLDPGSVHIPANLPRNVVPFRIRSSTGSRPGTLASPLTSNVDLPTDDTATAAAAAATARMPSFERVVTRASADQRPASSKVVKIVVDSEQQPARDGSAMATRGTRTRARAATSQGVPTSGLTLRPQTASEEIKQAYLQRTLLGEEWEKRREKEMLEQRLAGDEVKPRNAGRPVTSQSDASACEADGLVPGGLDVDGLVIPPRKQEVVSRKYDDYDGLEDHVRSSESNNGHGGSSGGGAANAHTTRSFDFRRFPSLKTQSRQNLRKAISARALPHLGSGRNQRPVTAQNLGATGGSIAGGAGGSGGAVSSASLLVELGFI